MKKIISIMLALCMLFGTLLLSGCGKKDTDAPDGMVLASSDDADYLCYMPEDWRIDKSTLYTSAYYSSGDATSISVTAYGLKYTDSTVEAWWEDFMTETEKVYSDISVDESSPEKATLGGVDGLKYSFSATLSEQEYDYIVVAAIKGNYIYYATYTSTPEYAEAHLEDFDSVIANFAFR